MKALLAVVVVLMCGCASARPNEAAQPERFIAGPAGKLRVSDGGAGAALPVVFVHGLGSSHKAWQAELDRLRPGRRAIAFDLRGHGDSDKPKEETGYSVAALTDDLEAVTSASGLQRFVLVGHSMAGVVLTAYAARHPQQVAGLVYVDAIGDFHVFPQAMIDQFLAEDDKRTDVHAAFAEMLGPQAPPATRDAVQADVAKMGLRPFVAIRRSMGGYRAADDIAKYGGPIACIDTEKEFPGSACKVIKRGKRSVIPGVGHWIMLDDPAAFAKAVDAALLAAEQG